MLYPAVQKAEFHASIPAPDSVRFIGKYSEIAANVFREDQIREGDAYTVRIEIAENAAPPFEGAEKSVTEEQYQLQLFGDGAILSACTEKGVFRAAHTLSRMLRSGDMRTGQISDFPAFSTRGYIEGFYGKPWTQAQRLSALSLMSQYGMNTYYYAPKDDLYHRQLWSVPYPEKELSDLRELFGFASSHYMDFYWCIGPGLSYVYSSEDCFRLLTEKILQLYGIGVRNFGLLLDDIPRELSHPEDLKTYGDLAGAQIDLIRKLYRRLKETDPHIRLTVCPTQYSGDSDTPYITRLGSSLPVEVSLFWTGAEVCSRVLPSREAREFLRSTGHKPLYWDNYPVNDCEMFTEMHLDGVQGRDRDLYLHAEGLISNVMEYAECSKIPLLTICDYLWNPSSYDRNSSVSYAHGVVLGDSEKAELFSYLADHLGVSCLTRYTSHRMASVLYKVWNEYAGGNKENALLFLDRYLARMRACDEMVQDKSIPLFAELDRWCRKFDKACSLLGKIREVLDHPCREQKALLEKMLEEYNYTGVPLTGFCLRELAEKTLSLKDCD